TLGRRARITGQEHRREPEPPQFVDGPRARRLDRVAHDQGRTGGAVPCNLDPPVAAAHAYLTAVDESGDPHSRLVAEALDRRQAAELVASLGCNRARNGMLTGGL